MEKATGYEHIKLVIDEDVRDLMEERLILAEDVQKVIYHGENTGNRLYNRDTGRFFTYFRPVGVTYWVEYSPEGEGFKVHNAYSHRMQIVENIKK